MIPKEAINRLTPFRSRFSNGTGTFQSVTGKQIDGLARRIRHLGRRIAREDEAHLMARKLEQTADYLRFRPPGKMAGDAARFARRNKLVPVAGAFLGGLLAYRLFFSNR